MNFIIAVPFMLSTFEFPNYVNSAKHSWISSRIVGGAPVNIINYPYQVALLLYGNHFCGGSIIAPKWILTAAHCIQSTSSSPYSIRAGSNNHAYGGVKVAAHTIHIHIRYSKITMENDIALVSLQTPLVYQNGIQPITLSAATTNIPSGTYAIATGWGTVREKGPGSNQLQAVAVQIVTSAACATAYKVTKISPNVLCAGFPTGGRDTCQGDSGGPLVASGFGQIGIVSWGYGCARPGLYGIYTSVTAFRNWIKVLSGV